MICRFILALMVLARVSCAQITGDLWRVENVDPGQDESFSSTFYLTQTENIRLQYAFTNLPYELASTNLIFVWEVTARTNVATVYLVRTGLVYSASELHFSAFGPTNTNLEVGKYPGFIRALEWDGATWSAIDTMARNFLIVLASPNATNYPGVTPLAPSPNATLLAYGTNDLVGRIALRDGTNATWRIDGTNLYLDVTAGGGSGAVDPTVSLTGGSTVALTTR
jgi:hypothetical protein